MRSTTSVFSFLISAWVGWQIMDALVEFSRVLSLLGQGQTSTDHSDDHVCLSVDERPILHERRPEARQAFYKHKHGTHFTDDGPGPELKTLKNAHFVIRTPLNRGTFSRISFWNDKEQNVEGDNLIPPNSTQAYTSHIILDDGGDYVAFTNLGWWEGHPGHFKHDVLPKIAYFRALLPTTTKFILSDTGSSRQVLTFLDKDFVDQRIVWLPGMSFDQVHTQITNDGTLTVPIRNSNWPYTGYHVLYNPLRAWIMQKLPFEEPERRAVIYYKRRRDKNAGKARAANGRVLNLPQGDQVLERIRNALSRHKRDDYDLVVFDGTDPDTGEVMSLENQFTLFRRAQTIIGPHGTGLGANLVWVDPSPKDCESRVQLLEFVPGADSARVHPTEPFMSHYPYVRGLAINYHTLLYLPDSNRRKTFIDVDMVDEFLDQVWGRDNHTITPRPDPKKEQPTEQQQGQTKGARAAQGVSQ